MKFSLNAFVNVEEPGWVFIIQFGQQEPNLVDVWQRKVPRTGNNGQLTLNVRISYKIN